MGFKRLAATAAATSASCSASLRLVPHLVALLRGRCCCCVGETRRLVVKFTQDASRMASRIEMTSIKQENEDNASHAACPDVAAVKREDAAQDLRIVKPERERGGEKPEQMGASRGLVDDARDRNVVNVELSEEEEDIGERRAKGLLCEECNEDFGGRFGARLDREKSTGQQTTSGCMRCGRKPKDSAPSVNRKECTVKKLCLRVRLKKISVPADTMGGHRVPKVAGEKPHKCMECAKTFSKRSNLEIHCRTHTGERPHVCEECGKGFTQRSNLDTHSRTHTGEKPHACGECGKRFTRHSNLEIHCRTHTGERPHVCPECGKGFTAHGDLNKHSRTHTGEKPFVCEECGKKFSKRYNLEAHYRLHSGEKPHICKECGERFSKRSTLEKHSRTHTGERPYMCEECGKRFTQRYNLEMHSRTHTGEKPHLCNECGKGFSQRSTLKKHSITHTGERPHMCQRCGKGFTTRTYLNKHSGTHASETLTS